MNLFKALEKGVKGVLEGKIFSVKSIRKGDKVHVFARVGIPDLCINFDKYIPEEFIPDAVEGAAIHFDLNGFHIEKVGKNSIPVLDMDIKGIFKGV